MLTTSVLLKCTPAQESWQVPAATFIYDYFFTMKPAGNLDSVFIDVSKQPTLIYDQFFFFFSFKLTNHLC